MAEPAFTLADLEAIVAERAHAEAGASYTRSLLEAGRGRIGKKLGEEAIETVIAGVEGDAAALVTESADLVYHLLVMLHSLRIPVQDVLDELGRRTARSGHEEKASRHAAPERG